ncbi:MAG: methyltransferase domain-containing protein [Rhodobacteraceae bacterium]|nr:methyltransferase domain-containing protein [Paracoccaceae bacterium]
MRQYADSAAFWTRKSKSYAKSNVRDPDAYEHTLAETRAALRPEDRVLELGCGTGTTALRLADAAGSYLAADISDGMIEIARGKAAQSGADVQFAVSDTAQAPDGPFDKVLAFNLLHLLPDLESALQDIHARLAPGGVMISKTVCAPDGRASVFFRVMMGLLPLLQRVGQAPFVSIRPVAELEAMIRAAGFDIERSENHNEGPPSRFIVARKP